MLQRDDQGLLIEPKGLAGGTLPELDEAREAIRGLKKELIHRKEATELFGQEQGHGFAGLLGNLN